MLLEREREGRRSYIGTKIDRQTYTVRQTGCGTYCQAVRLTDRPTGAERIECKKERQMERQPERESNKE